MSRVALPVLQPGAATDVARWPLIGPLLRKRRWRSLVRATVLVIALAAVADGFWGPDLAPKNLATLLTWVHFRGLVVLGLVLGNLWCFACPFVFARDQARRLIAPTRSWPRALRGKWLSTSLFIAVLLAYEGFDIWASPWATALLISIYLVSIVVIDSIFTHASFCKWICPIGQFNFIASLISSFEVRARDGRRCEQCASKDCIRGRREGPPPGSARAPGQGRGPPLRGCELGLYVPRKLGNLDCTFCLDCLHACPHDNVTVQARLAAQEIWTDRPRSNIGRLLRRRDVAVLVVVFAFGALLNAFAMTSPVYAVAAWLATGCGWVSEWALLSVLFVMGLVVTPALLVLVAAALSRSFGGARESLSSIATRQVFSFVPLGVGIWIAHYAFHFLTAFGALLPVGQRMLHEVGVDAFGAPNWRQEGLPLEIVYSIEFGALGLGLMMSCVTAVRVAGGSRGVGLPWAALNVVLAAAAAWVLSQPMEMRGSLL